MARRCDICGKGPITGHRISHSHHLTKRRWLPNLQRVRVMVNGRPQRLTVCTNCIKSGRVLKVPPPTDRSEKIKTPKQEEEPVS